MMETSLCKLLFFSFARPKLAKILAYKTSVLKVFYRKSKKYLDRALAKTFSW